MTVAIYPGSFDPIHNGHVDIAARAAGIFDHLTVAIYARPSKSILFSVEERASMARKALQHLPNVTVASYTGTTVAFAQKSNAHVLVRGLRMAYDFDKEYQMALTNKALSADIETICLFTNLNCAFLSSSIVKDIVAAGGDVADMVPAHVKQRLEARLLHSAPSEGR